MLVQGETDETIMYAIIPLFASRTYAWPIECLIS